MKSILGNEKTTSHQRHLKGQKLEQQSSLEFHQWGIPILASPLLLRKWGGGQIDLARLEDINSRKKITVLEVKSQSIVSNSQKKKLSQSCDLLGSIFSLPVFLTYFFQEESSLID